MTEVPVAGGTRSLSLCERVLSVDFVTDEQTETYSNNCTPGLSSIKHMIEISQGVHLCFTFPKLVWTLVVKGLIMRETLINMSVMYRIISKIIVSQCIHSVFHIESC